MIKLKTPLILTKLWQHKFYKEKIQNVNRWNLTLRMLRRHDVLHEYVPEICDEEVVSLLLNQAYEKNVDGSPNQLDELNKISMPL